MRLPGFRNRSERPGPSPAEIEEPDLDLRARLYPDARRTTHIGYDGTCPDCGHEISGTHWLTLVRSDEPVPDPESLARLAELLPRTTDAGGSRYKEFPCAATATSIRPPS